MMADVGNETS